MGLKLGWRVLILFIISYVVFWGFFMELGLAIMVPIAYYFSEKRYGPKDEAKGYPRTKY